MEKDDKRLKNLKSFTKGDERINRKGRPANKILSLKKGGYTQTEINNTIKILLAMSKDELLEAAKNESATVLEVWIARAIQSGINKGDLRSFMDLCNRMFGTPKQEIESKNETTHKIDFEQLTDEELRNIREIQRKLTAGEKEST